MSTLKVCVIDDNNFCNIYYYQYLVRFEAVWYHRRIKYVLGTVLTLVKTVMFIELSVFPALKFKVLVIALSVTVFKLLLLWKTENGVYMATQLIYLLVKWKWEKNCRWIPVRFQWATLPSVKNSESWPHFQALPSFDQPMWCIDNPSSCNCLPLELTGGGQLQICCWYL